MVVNYRNYGECHMDKLASIVKNFISHKHEEEWFEFKENWFESHALGEYISAMSNAAAMAGEEYAYFVWGIENNTHNIKGTVFDFHQDVKNEPTMALWGGKDGLFFYRKLAKEAPLLIKPGGRILLEVGYKQAKLVGEILAENNWQEISFHQDYQAFKRVVEAKYLKM